jgi:hypothetical protein
MARVRVSGLSVPCCLDQIAAELKSNHLPAGVPGREATPDWESAPAKSVASAKKAGNNCAFSAGPRFFL